MRFSIVIPAYNAQDVLITCVSSVLSQEGVELEVIIVDDGSRDATLEVARKLSASDPRIRVVAKPNGGVSSARNAGLAAVTGDVVLFVDADDELVPGALASIDQRMSYGGVDCVVFGVRIDPPERAPLTLSHRLKPSNAIIEDNPHRLIFEEPTHPYAFRVAFMRDFLALNGLRFDERLSLGEDEHFLMVAYALAHRAITTSEQLYVYRMSDESASHKDNASDEVLSQKVDKHLALVSSVFESWRGRDLDHGCDADLLLWALDLLLLDTGRLDLAEQKRVCRELWKTLVGYFGEDGGRSLLHGSAAHCLDAVAKAASSEGELRSPAVSKRLLVPFYISSRGLSAVGERAWAMLHGRGAY